MTSRRAARLAGLVLLVVMAAAGCGNGGSPSPSAAGSSDSASSDAPITTVATNDRYPFDQTSAQQFPGTSLDTRLTMAKEVCDSIAQHGDDYPAWLTLLATQGPNTLVSFQVTKELLTSFSGLAVKTVCPQYLDQLQGALSSLSSSLSSSSASASASG